MPLLINRVFAFVDWLNDLGGLCLIGSIEFMLILILLLFYLLPSTSFIKYYTIKYLKDNSLFPIIYSINDVKDSQNNNTNSSFDKNPYSPLLMCSYLPEEFIHCSDPLDVATLKGSNVSKPTNREEAYCAYRGTQRWQSMQMVQVRCEANQGVDCFGPRVFTKRNEVPCLKYTDHYFLTTLLYSLLLGYLGIDRFALGYTGSAVGKLLTLGGLGVWWIVDVVLLITGHLGPADGSNWTPYY